MNAPLHKNFAPLIPTPSSLVISNDKIGLQNKDQHIEPPTNKWNDDDKINNSCGARTGDM